MLTITNLSKTYPPATPVLHNINLTLDAGEIVCLLGPSGCGKTTLLRLVAGLEQPDRGQIMLNGHDLRHLPVHQRNFGLMFQEFALFPHRTVAQNIAFGLQSARHSRTQIQQRVEAMLALVNLTGYGDRTIFALSGGERQRVALARSLAPQPQLLMLDEPLGSLDRTLREELMVELRTILKAVGVTALYVTHDQQEAFAVADRLVVMRQGHIEQIGPAQAIYDMPATLFVARFLGFHNRLPLADAAAVAPLGLTYTQLGTHLPHLAAPIRPDATLLIRPDAVRALGTGHAPAAPAADHLLITGALQSLLFRGSYHQIVITLPVATPLDLHFDIPTHLMPRPLPQPGAPLWLHLDPAAFTLIPPAIT